MTDVFMNEKFIGTVENADQFIQSIIEKRREGKFPSTLNLNLDQKQDAIFMQTTKGRAVRPLIIVENGKSKLTDAHITKLKNDEITFDELVTEGVVEYLDALEEEMSLIALDENDLTPEHTHLEISPLTILGVISSLVPYANYGSSSRMIRGSKLQKQGLGLYRSNFLLRMDTDVSVLHYSQKPLVNTFMHKILDFDKNPGGQNVVVAIMSYEGYNMQDAIILNRGSIDRGFGRSTYFRPYEAEELRYSGGLIDNIKTPDKESKGYRTEQEYRHLEKDGIAYTGAKLGEEDVIIGKTSPPRFLGEMGDFSITASIRRESSVALKHGELGIVDMTIITENEEGNRLVQVRVRDTRIVEVGDKFASRHGQKGVAGLIVPPEDMPITVSGVTPDLIFSPHSLPSRMTMSHLIEVIAGKTAALTGEYVDGTTFDAQPEHELREMLHGMGFRDNGTETMYNGQTGERYQAKIFIGNMYYLKLKHMVANKMHARASGRIQLLTRQPIEGRGKGGGLRLGEMEKDCFVAHGASLLLKERFDSDKTTVHVCEKCGMLGVVDTFRNKKFCPTCGNNVDITAVEVSYAFKLLLDELKSLGVYPRLGLESKY
ncbi:DNA-directed RNA polymerase subunit B [archaeon]|nr:DNA-directed RNA polymerase subunit B [archaeon]